MKSSGGADAPEEPFSLPLIYRYARRMRLQDADVRT
jgi:hypothetical protein